MPKRIRPSDGFGSDMHYVIDASANLFKPKLVDDSIHSDDFVELRPISAIKTGHPVQFEIAGSSELFIDLTVYLKIQLKLVKSNGSDLDNDMPVAMVNNTLHSLWNQVDVAIGGKELSPSTGNYMYSAYLKNHIFTSSDAKLLLQTQGYHPDTPDNFNSTDPANNAGFKSRMGLFADSKTVTFYGSLLLDMFLQERLIPPEFSISIKFHPNKVSFLVMSGSTPPSQIYTLVDVLLYYKKVSLIPSLATAVAKSWQNQPAVYPVKRTVVTVFEQPAGTVLVNRTIVSYSQVPDKVIVGITSAAAYNGSYVHNPFNFSFMDCSLAEVYVDSKRVPTNGF